MSIAFCLVTWWSSFMCITMYFLDKNILLQIVHCHAWPNDLIALLLASDGRSVVSATARPKMMK